MVDPIAIVEGCIVIGSSINRAIQSVRSHKNDCMVSYTQLNRDFYIIRNIDIPKTLVEY